MNLLVVDDEQHVRQLCADVASQSGMKVTTVATAEEALAVMENYVVDILMTDLKLPESSGLDLLQRSTKPSGSGGDCVDAIRDDRFGGDRHAPGRGGLCYQTLSAGRTAHPPGAGAQGVELQQENRLLREQLRTGRDLAG